jgi:hypothetical protein
MRPRAVIDDNVVRIKFANSDGSVSDNPREMSLHPVIEFSLTQCLPGGSSLPSVNGVALIDTGADHSAIDRAFAEAAGFVPTGTASPSGIGGIVQETSYYDLRYSIKTNGGNKSSDARYVAIPLIETGRLYQAIFGMSFLQTGRLIMDAKSHDYFFEFNSMS